MSKKKANEDDNDVVDIVAKKQKLEKFDFSNLPHEILLQVFQFLNKKELCQAARLTFFAHF
jgi:hypothetical protein